MYFHKIHHPANFSFATRCQGRKPALRIGRESYPLRIDDLGDEVFRLRIGHRKWPRRESQAELATRLGPRSHGALVLSPAAGIALCDAQGQAVLTSRPDASFGVSGRAWLLQFAYDRSLQFYGMGEKNLGLELSGRRTKFWNADVWADFSFDRIVHHSTDPMYVSIPYLIVKRGNTYSGVLIDNPHAAFMATAPDLRIADQMDASSRPDADFYVGAPDGQPDLYFLHGPSLAELTRKLQRLCGTTPRPPLWALGHQQCRWGYRGFDDLDRLERTYRRHRIPNDGLWLDIDYMRGFRVFTLDAQHFAQPQKQLAELRRRGQRVVPILDPGVKVEAGYEVYDSGVQEDIFCRNPEGKPYVGFVWPGATVFPDFSLPEGRSWWADEVRRFAAAGLGGFWIDMNDPATGASELSEMLFRRGRAPHETFHNQYALGMARATREGLLLNAPDERPFVISRSGFIGTSRYSAIWTGDNFSNEHHLRQCIPISLNLALSGVPFNGPDVPGFGGDATPELAQAWYKVCFLFPFLRNHAAIGTRVQEPWAFGASTLGIVRHFIRLRYKLLPYLYQLFIDQEQRGSAILRPLFHDFADTAELPLGRIADQYLVGPALLQAPFTSLGAGQREVVLPEARWYDACAGRWLRGGRRLKVRAEAASTPLYVRDGSVVPMQVGERKDNRNDLADVEFHLWVSPSFRGEVRTTYRFDDGTTFAYRNGKESCFELIVRRGRGGLQVEARTVATGAGPLRARFVVYSTASHLHLTHQGQERQLALHATTWRFTGRPLPVRVSSPVVLGA